MISALEALDGRAYFDDNPRTFMAENAGERAGNRAVLGR